MQTVEEGKERLDCGKKKGKNKFGLHDSFLPGIHLVGAYYLLCVGFTKRTSTGGLKIMFEFHTFRFILHKGSPFMLSKAKVSILRRGGIPFSIAH